MKEKVILIVGSANMDMVVKTPRFPYPGETLLGEKFEMFPGGKGANQAVCCAKLGGKVTFVGRMGEDAFKDKLIKSMSQDGVDLTNLFIDTKHPTGTAFILVNAEGENEIIVVSGSNMSISPADIDQKSEIFSSATVVLTQLEIPMESVLKTAQLANDNNAIFILNPAPANTLPDEILPLIEYLTPNENELEMLTGKKVVDINSAVTAANILLEKGVKNIIVTLGENGAVWVTKNNSKHFHARKVNVVDTTAAGDAFNGALAFSLAHGELIEKAIGFANLVASVSVTSLGAQNSMPTIEEIKSLD